jgi:glycine/D-amino acid oxidase-like deaminating enzyme
VNGDYRDISYWLESSGDDLTPRPSLPNSIDVDVAILGAGFTGLWTAYYLLRAHPSLTVAVVEAEIAGFGASGRNGAWCTSEFPVSPALLAERYGAEATRRLQLALFDTVDEVGRVIGAEGIDAQYTRGGELLVARGTHHLPAIQGEYEELQRLGLGEYYSLLDAAQTAEHIRIAGAAGALYGPHTAVLHPGRLVRGLARTVERLGGTVYERTAVSRVRPGRHPRFDTPHGEVRAKTLILAGEAYLSQLPGWHRRLVPLYSLIVLTEQLTSEQWSEIGWERRESVASARYTVDYLSKTADGRILFGGRGAPYHFGSDIQRRYDRHGPTHAMLREMFVRWFPSLRGVRFTHAWGGPLGMPRDWMPSIRYDAAANVAMAGGYTGQGVAMSNLSGRTLTDLITGTPSHLIGLPMVGRVPPRWEPEPFRWAAIRTLQTALMRIDDRAEATGKPPSGKTPFERLARH